MVNTGKPSRGCEPCKKRHVKCDLTLPYCRKCLDSGRTCPGVPDENDLRFVKQRDPSKPRKRKATAPKQTTPPVAESSSTPNSKDGNFDSAVELDSKSPTPTAVVLRTRDQEPETAIVKSWVDTPRSLSPTWEDVAVSFFFDNFMTGDSKWVNPVVKTLQQTWRTANFKRNSVTDNSTAAVALAALSHYPDLPHLKSEAIRHYQKALRLTHAALSDPVESRNDDTLLAVILMGMYERIAASDDVSQVNLLQHSMGAVALVQHRGVPTVPTSASYQLFSVVRGAMILEYAAEGTPIDVNDLNNFWFAAPMDPDDYNTNLYYRGMMVPDLRSRARLLFRSTAQLPNKDEVSDLLADARAVDTKLLDWFQHLPDEWSYYSIHHMPDKPVDVDNSPVWPGAQHVYKDLFLASILNNYRIFRIFTQSVIAQCLSALDERQTGSHGPPTSFLYSATLQTVRFLVDDIAGSVPANFAITLGKLVNFPRSRDSERQLRAKEALGGFYLMRPLWVASCVEGIDDLQKRWLKGRLKFIAEEYGLSQASSLSESKVVFPMSWRTNIDPEHSELLYFHP